jgi:ADP-ribose pyrophosphatase YjhB (NUDIX family)
MRNAALRNICRVGYWVLWASSFVVKRSGRGAKCALINDGELLLVRHTYGPREWDLPGGGAHRGEDALTAIRRELREELGVEVEDPTLLGVGGAGGRFAAAHVSYFTAALPDRSVRPDPVEIAEVAWCTPATPPPGRLGLHARQMLARHGEALASPAGDPGSPTRG